MNATLEEISRVAGLPAAIKLCRHFGGRTISIPKQAHDTHPIALAIGITAAEALSGYIGGEQLSVPPESSALLLARNAQIVEGYQGGATISHLAREYGYSRAWIIRILERAGVRREGP